MSQEYSEIMRRNATYSLYKLGGVALVCAPLLLNQHPSKLEAIAAGASIMAGIGLYAYGSGSRMLMLGRILSGKLQ